MSTSIHVISKDGIIDHPPIFSSPFYFVYDGIML